MRKFVSILLLSLSIITLIACTKNKQQSLDGEYYWTSSERNELAFTIKGNRGSIKHGEADSFTIDQESNTFLLSGENITKKAVKHIIKHFNNIISRNRAMKFWFLMMLLSE